MSTQSENNKALLKAGKITEARALLETEKLNAKFYPDTVVAVPGKPPRLTKKGKRVELGEDGKWGPKK